MVRSCGRTSECIKNCSTGEGEKLFKKPSKTFKKLGDYVTGQVIQLFSWGSQSGFQGFCDPFYSDFL